MTKWRMRFEVLTHRLRGHQVRPGGDVRIYNVLPGGGFTFQVSPVFRCSCGVEWEDALNAAIRDAARRQPFGSKGGV